MKLRFLVILFSFYSNTAISSDRESTVCGWFKERLVFMLWSMAAPKPDESRISGNSLIEKVSFRTTDNRMLRGYKYLSHDKTGQSTEPVGYLLVALGNAMLADQIIVELKPFSESGYDVYIFDYRGYGLSEGRRRIKAYIEDYKDIVAYLNTKYRKHLLYGISLGGAVIANVIGDGVVFDRAVIDSSPSRFSPHGCPKEIDPVENIPVNAENIMVITGTIDTVLNPDMTSEFRTVAESRGATVFDGPDYSHPFMDRNIEVHRNRLQRIFDFLDHCQYQ